jgi:outer membrane protein
MRTKWKALVLVTPLILMAGNAQADELVSLKAGYQLLSASGSLAGTGNGGGQEVDIERDLDLDNSHNLTAEIALQWDDSRFSLNYLPIDFSGTGTLTVTGSYNGQAFSTNDRVKSDVRIDLYDFAYTYYLLNMNDLPSRFQLGVELAVKVADAEISFNDQTQSFVESNSATVPIPTIGVRSRIALGDFAGVVGRVGYMGYSGNHFLDAEAQIEFSPIPMFGAYAGYRYFDLKIDESDIYVDTQFSGPFLGLMARF